MREINLEIVGRDLKEKLGIKDIDIKPIVDGLSDVSKAVKDKKFDKVDTKNIEKLLKVISDKKQDNSDVIEAINDLVEVLSVERNEQDYSDKFDALIEATNNMPQLFRPAYNSYNPQIRDKEENIINPSTSEKQDEILQKIEESPSTFESESLWLLRRLVKLMESQGTVDPQNRQRVLVEGTTNILPSSYYAAAQQWNLATNSIPISNNGTNITYIQPVQTGPVDPRWQIIDQARLVYDAGIRSHISFS